jgi:uncharacterized protein (TIGR02246 family)
MTARFLTLFASALLATACADADQEDPDAATPPAAEVTAEEAALEQLRADYMSHYNLHHPDVVAGMFTDSAFALWADGTVSMSRAQVQSNLEADMASSPTLDLQTDDVMVFGDNAVARGSYSVNLSPAGADPVTLTGNYLTHFNRTDGAWKINGVATNFNALPPEGAVPEAPADDEPPPPDSGTMGDIVAAYTQMMSAGDWAGLANLYTEDAVASFSNAPQIEGRSAIQARFAERFTGPATIELHDVGTLDLGAGYAIDGGWFTLTAPTPEGNVTQGGTYLNLMQQQPDGSWKIHWSLSNGQPVPAA